MLEIDAFDNCAGGHRPPSTADAFVFLQQSGDRLKARLAQAAVVLDDGPASDRNAAWCAYLQLDQQLAAHAALHNRLSHVASLPDARLPSGQIEILCSYIHAAVCGREPFCRIFVDAAHMPGWMLLRAGALIYELAQSLSRNAGQRSAFAIEIVFYRSADGWCAGLVAYGEPAAALPAAASRAARRLGAGFAMRRVGPWCSVALAFAASGPRRFFQSTSHGANAMPPSSATETLLDWPAEASRLERRAGVALARGSQDPWLLIEAEYTLDLIELELFALKKAAAPSGGPREQRLVQCKRRLESTVSGLRSLAD